MTDLSLLPFVEQADLVRNSKLSAGELLDHYAKRVERHNGALNAVVATDFERAREAAAAAVEREADALNGIPMTIKDAYETEGIASTGGAVPLKEHVPHRDAVAVARLRAKGAIIFGKTNVPVLSADWQSFNEVYGTTNNPWDPGRTPGGSSGGAAAAVAAGLSAAELGSDIGGSIRLPAHFCGIYGHKPSHGIVPMAGHIPPAPRAYSQADLAVAGPLARSAEDLAILLDILAGDDGDAVHPHPPLADSPHPRPQDLRIAVWRDDPAAPVDAAVGKAVERAAEALEAAGARVERGVAPDIELAHNFGLFATVMSAIIAAEFPEKVRRRLIEAARSLDPEDRSFPACQARGAALTYREMLSIETQRTRIKAAWRAFFEKYHAVLCPPASVVAFPHDHTADFGKRSIRVNGAEAPYFDLLHWAAPASFAHLPATVAPVLRTEEGLPAGVQIIGPYLGDRTTIRIARLLEMQLGPYVAPPGYG